ncbi:MAG: helix-turn-helix domain-containing protein [Paenibacillus sp.]|nr:helix-turn-helix domain-containing protein [Paenibacillus sp.]
MSTIEEAIASIVAAQVFAAEKRIMERLSVQSDRTLTFTETCEYLGMSDYTLRNLCKAKRIPYRTIGSEGSRSPRYLFTSSSLDRWIREEEDRNWRRVMVNE